MIEIYGDKDRIVGEMIRGRKIQQTFIAVGEKLNNIDIEFATFQRMNDCEVVLEIFDGQKIIISEIIEAKNIKDNAFYRLKVEKSLQKNKPYELRIYSPNGRTGNSITLKLGRPRHDNMWVRINGAQVRGELCSVFYYDDIEKKSVINVEKSKEETVKIETKKEIEVVNSKTKEISIIIPTAKRLDHLKKCLDSISANTENYEIIVIVNSPDKNFRTNANKLLELYSNIITIVVPSYAGYVVPCNMGAAISSGQFLCVMNDDVIVRKNWNKEMIEVLKKNNKVMQVGPSMAYLTDDFHFSHTITKHPYLEGWCFIIPRKIYDKCGLFDKDIDFAYCEDSDFSTNLISKGYKIQKVNAPIIHIGHQTSKQSGIEMKKLTDTKEEANKQYLRKKWKNHMKGK